MNNVVIAGAGMTPFARTPGRGVRSLANEAVDAAISDAGITPDVIDMVFFGNAIAPTVTQQDMVKGQVALRHGVLEGLPVINIENACASASSSFNLGYKLIKGGQADVVVVVGAEQMTHENKELSFRALRGATDITEIGEAGPDEDWTQSLLMKFYAQEGTELLEHTKASREDFGRIAVKNRHHASMNPYAQFRKEETLEEVMEARLIADPLTLLMCSPMSDGGAAAVLMSEDYAKKNVSGPLVRILGTEVGGTRNSASVTHATTKLYDATGLTAKDMDVIELHDAAAPAEIIQYGQIGLAEKGEEYQLVRDGVTSFGGRYPVNMSGGLLSRGHALGATGLAQIFELTMQLRGEVGERQVEGAKRALAVNTGGWVNGDYPVAVASILERV